MRIRDARYHLDWFRRSCNRRLRQFIAATTKRPAERADNGSTGDPA